MSEKVKMLHNTFIHLPHIGQVTEQRLWQNGINTWQDLMMGKNHYAKKFQHLAHFLKLSEQKLQQYNARFFIDRLSTDQHWRLFPEFQFKTAYIDIETTGLGGPSDYITTISIYDGKNVYNYVHGKNIEQFKYDIKNYSVLVSYNGKCFDIPFIEREFSIQLTQAHLDLRYILRSLGIKGGLKSCERQIGLRRGDLEGVDGYFAVLLWKDYLQGNKKALDTLLAYNIEDTVNLEKLMLYAYERKIENLKLDKRNIISLPGQSVKTESIKIPFQPDYQTIKKIWDKYY